MKQKWTELYEKAAEEAVKWRESNRKATLTEIETNVDEKLSRLRAQMIQELAMASEVADMRGLEKEKRPKCPKCQRRLQANGKQKRTVYTDYEQPIALTRSHGKCPECGQSFFPSG